MLRTNTIHVLPGYHSLHLGTLFRRVAAPVRRVSHSAEACAATSTLGRMALAMPELEQQLRSARDLRGHGGLGAAAVSGARGVTFVSRKRPGENILDRADTRA